MLKIIFLECAESDLREIKHYILENFSRSAWLDCYQKMKRSILALQFFPDAGSIPPELDALNLSQYRQIISGKNRIIYERRDQTIYIHLIADTRKDLQSVLFKRLMTT